MVRVVSGNTWFVRVFAAVRGVSVGAEIIPNRSDDRVLLEEIDLLFVDVLQVLSGDARLAAELKEAIGAETDGGVCVVVESEAGSDWCFNAVVITPVCVHGWIDNPGAFAEQCPP